MRRIPILPTIFVLAAAATMVALGFWQLARKAEKEALLAHYARVSTLSSDVPFPRDPAAIERSLYRHSTVRCAAVVSQRTIPGTSLAGRSGIAQIAHCRLEGGGEADIALGWAPAPGPYAWEGGEVGGFLAPASGGGVRLVAGNPPAGLEPLAPPDPSAIPNNHLAYAWQWFFFAATALVIYGLALRRRGSRT